MSDATRSPALAAHGVDRLHVQAGLVELVAVDPRAEASLDAGHYQA